MLEVQIDALNRRFGALHVLKDVSLTIEPGEFTVLLGPSGCGKSTLLASIAGLDELDGGRILFNGKDVTGLEPAERDIGMVFQSYALYPTMTVRQNLSFGLEVARLSKAEIDKRVDWASELLKIAALLDRKPGQLSGGQRQRVAIGRALVREAQLFLFDEPLSNLDAKLRTEMRVEIKSLHQRLGSTFIYVTHDQIEAMTMATRIAVMNNGRVEQYAAPEEVYSRPASLFVADFVGSPPMNLIPATLRKAEGRLRAEFAGTAVDISAYPFKAPVEEGEAIVLGIRPEDVVVGGAEPATVTTPLVVVEPLGADTLAWVELDGKRLAARMPPAQAAGLTQSLPLGFPPERLSIFSQASTLRL